VYLAEKSRPWRENCLLLSVTACSALLWGPDKTGLHAGFAAYGNASTA
jgi:hypothetical protein